jgi:hypothetical protein
VTKLVWRVEPVTELQAGETTAVGVARIERDKQAGLADLGLRLAEAKPLTAALQAEIVPAQVTIAGEHRSTCAACGRGLASKGYYTATFRSLFGYIPRDRLKPWRASQPSARVTDRAEHRVVEMALGRDGLPALFSPRFETVSH